MQIAERSAGNVVVLDLSGEITFATGGQPFKDKIDSLVGHGQKSILVNMGGVTYVDSTGLGELVTGYTTVKRAGGEMKLANLTKRLHHLLHITKLLTILETYESEQEALTKFRVTA